MEKRSAQLLLLMEMKFVTWVQILDGAVYVSPHANILVKDMCK